MPKAKVQSVAEASSLRWHRRKEVFLLNLAIREREGRLQAFQSREGIFTYPAYVISRSRRCWTDMCTVSLVRPDEMHQLRSIGNDSHVASAWLSVPSYCGALDYV